MRTCGRGEKKKMEEKEKIRKSSEEIDNREKELVDKVIDLHNENSVDMRLHVQDYINGAFAKEKAIRMAGWDDMHAVRDIIESEIEKIKGYGFHTIHAYLLLASVLQNYRRQCLKLVEKVQQEEMAKKRKVEIINEKGEWWVYVDSVKKIGFMERGRAEIEKIRFEQSHIY